MPPELDDVMNAVATGIQQMIFPPLIPVYFQCFVFIHAGDKIMYTNIDVGLSFF